MIQVLESFTLYAAIFGVISTMTSYSNRYGAECSATFEIEVTFEEVECKRLTAGLLHSFENMCFKQ